MFSIHFELSGESSEIDGEGADISHFICMSSLDAKDGGEFCRCRILLKTVRNGMYI